jgi:FkbH-like protein
VEQRVLFSEVKRLAQAGNADDALRMLRDSVRRGQLDAAGIEKAGRLCQTLLPVSTEKIGSRILMLGQCTTTWLTATTTAIAWGDGTALSVSEGAYDSVLQELLQLDVTSGRPNVVVLLPWQQRLLFNGSMLSARERVDAECAFWHQAWTLITERLTARILQVGYDSMSPGAQGYMLGARTGGDLAMIRAVNQELRDSLPSGAVFVDLEHVSGEIGRERFYDPRRYFWTKQPFSEDGTVRLARHISAGIRAQITGPKKVLVLDLDNTLWGGVVGETGPLGIRLGDGPDGEAFSAFQKHLKRLSERGIVLAACSKNNDADAREPFEKNPNMVLSLDDFAQFEASWDPKAIAIRRIAKALELGLDSFVFFDDNPAEQEHVRQALPEVMVVDVPDDPAEYIRTLDAGLWFEAVDLTDEDRARAKHYRAARRRRDTEVQFESIDSYLESLEMVADLRSIDEPDMDRVVQLIGKTNQFNLTTRRHGPDQVRRMLTDPTSIGLTLRVADRFGDYGLVSVLIAVADPDATTSLVIDTWLMSCRVISRTVEEFLFNALVEAARSRGIESLVGVYAPTAKNALVKDLFERLGFTRLKDAHGDSVTYRLNIAAAVPVKSFVQNKDAVLQGSVA